MGTAALSRKYHIDNVTVIVILQLVLLTPPSLGQREMLDLDGILLVLSKCFAIFREELVGISSFSVAVDLKGSTDDFSDELGSRRFFANDSKRLFGKGCIRRGG